MDKVYFFIPKKTFLLITLLLVAIVVLVLILFISQSKKVTSPPSPVISQSPSPLSPLQKTIIGKTTINDIGKSYPSGDKQTLPNGDLKYSVNSKLEARPDQIIFHNNVTQFERIIILGNTSLSGNTKLSDQVAKYGPAEKVIKGSKFYGYHMDTYIYPAKGIAFIANTYADEIEEIQIFTPTSLENYISNYGEDIKEYKQIKE